MNNGMKLTRTVVLIMSAIMSLTSCIRDEIHDIQRDYHVTYDMDGSVLYNASDLSVDLLWLRFYDVNTNKRIYETWAHPDGTDLTIIPGRYNIVAYSYRNNATKFSYETDLSLLTAYTESVRTPSDLMVSAAPAHFYYGMLKNYNVPYVAAEEPPHEIVLPMKSPLESWRVVVTGIRNLKNCRSATFYLTHQRTDILLGSMEKEGDGMMQFGARIDSAFINIDTPFNTFGMVPDMSYELQIQITDASEATYLKTVDVTAQINDPENTEHIITFDYDITLLQMQEGGVVPSADPWEEHEEHHIIK